MNVHGVHEREGGTRRARRDRGRETAERALFTARRPAPAGKRTGVLLSACSRDRPFFVPNVGRRFARTTGGKNETSAPVYATEYDGNSYWSPPTSGTVLIAPNRRYAGGRETSDRKPSIARLYFDCPDDERFVAENDRQSRPVFPSVPA